MAKRDKKKIFHENFTDKIIPSVFSTVITDGIPVGDSFHCGMGGNFFATLDKIPTAGFRLESRRYLFKIFLKNYLLIVKKT
jgi:hypothetical protein